MPMPDTQLPPAIPPALPVLPPGQRAIAGFPRFGTHMHRPPPRIPDRPALLVDGEVGEPFRVDLRELADLPVVEQVGDLHCVAGWSAVGLRWSGVRFAVFYEEVVAPRLRADAAVTHIVASGQDGFAARIRLEDLLQPDVLLATGLDGAPLPAAHGAPLRLVSPSQYGHMSIKHLSRIRPCRIEGAGDGPAQPVGAGGLIRMHPRARVWSEERHPNLPAALVRPLYRLFVTPGIALGAVGAHATRVGPASPTAPAARPAAPPRAVR
jgi:DMSO/TMAO reductase YedYZ molybdopterin-dependent catalytic subunit